MQLDWVYLDTNGFLLDFDRLNLAQVTQRGVYMIYVPGTPATTIYVGKGDIADRLAAHRNDTRILTARSLFTQRACVGFASVPALSQAGVERYLARRHAPLVGERYPAVQEIAVNSLY